jgi:hypothetical protein
MSRLGVLAALVAVLGAATADAYHAGDMIMGSTSPGGGSLAIRYDFTRRTHVSPSIDLAGTVLYTGTDPGFDALDVAEPPLNILAIGTPVSVEVVSIDGPVSLQVKAPILTAPGASAALGNMTADGDGLHVHPTWRLMLPADAPDADYRVTFRLTTTASQYTPSEAYTMIVTNAVEDTTTTTTSLPPGASTTTTSTLPPAPCADRLPGSDAAAACWQGLLRGAVDELATPDRRARRAARTLSRLAAACGRLLDRASAASDRHAARIRGRTLARLRTIESVVVGARARASLPADQLAAIGALAESLRQQVAAAAGP